MEAPSFDGATLVSKNHCHSNKVLQKQHCGVVSTEQWVVAAKRSKLVSVRPSCVSRVNLLGSAVSSGEPVNSQPKYQSASKLEYQCAKAVVYYKSLWCQPVTRPRQES